MCHSRVYFKSIRKGTFHPGDVHRTQRGEAACDAFQLDANKAAVRAIMSDVFRTRHASLSKTGWRFPCFLYCKNLEHFRIQCIFTLFWGKLLLLLFLTHLLFGAKSGGVWHRGLLRELWIRLFLLGRIPFVLWVAEILRIVSFRLRFSNFPSHMLRCPALYFYWSLAQRETNSRPFFMMPWPGSPP